MKIPTKSAQISVRFKRGIPKQLARLAARQGLRRTEWVREIVLSRVNLVLDRCPVVPLSFVTTTGDSERVLIRLTETDLKRIERAARTEGTLSSTYVRALCMARLEAAGDEIIVGDGGKLELAADGEGAPVMVEDGGTLTIKIGGAEPDPMYIAGAARDARRRKRERGEPSGERGARQRAMQGRT